MTTSHSRIPKTLGRTPAAIPEISINLPEIQSPCLSTKETKSRSTPISLPTKKSRSTGRKICPVVPSSTTAFQSRKVCDLQIQYHGLTSSLGPESSMIFIQKSYLDNFKGKLSGNTFSVDDGFQYGQKNAQGEGRWLAYHDKSQKAYQVSQRQSCVSWRMRKIG